MSPYASEKVRRYRVGWRQPGHRGAGAADGPDRLSCYPQLMDRFRVLAGRGLTAYAIADQLAIRLVKRSLGSNVLGACAKR